MRRHSAWRAVPVAVGVLVGAGLWVGCGGGDQTPSTSPTAVTTATQPSTPPATTTTSTTTTATPSAVRPAPDGITVAGTPVAFSTPVATLDTALSPILGAPVSQAVNDECGAGPLTIRTYSAGGLQSLADPSGAFVGWFLDGRNGTSLTTTSGLTAGSSRSDVENAGGTVEESSLGWEFSGPVNGLLSDEEGVVVSLWAGTNCIFR